MALPKSLTQPLRQGQLNIGDGWRGYFAPFNQALAVTQTSTSKGPTIYDLEVTGRFIDAPPPPPGWFDLGLIDKFKITPASKIGAVKTGFHNVTRAKYRAEISETCSFVFREASRMAHKIVTGTIPFNLLKSTAPPSTLGPISSSGTPAVAMGASGYVPGGLGTGPYAGQPVLFVASGSGAQFPAQSYIVCDQDYVGGTAGFVGDSGAVIYPGTVTDVDYIRKTSDYVGCVLASLPGGTGGVPSGQDALVLTGPFVGGGNNPVSSIANTGPTAGAKVQAIAGWVNREGGAAISEWSGIFVLDTADINQMLVYYPRLSINQFAGIEEVNLDGSTSAKEQQYSGSFEALAFDDPLDGETVVRYIAYYPRPGMNIQI